MTGAGAFAPGYWDVEGTWHDNDPAAEAAVVAALAAGHRRHPATGRGLPLVVWGDAAIEIALTADGSGRPEGVATLAYEDGPTVHVDIAGAAVLSIDGPHPAGYHLLSVWSGHPADPPEEHDVIVAPDRVAGPARDERVWGVFAPLYSITHDDGREPTFTDLDTLGRTIAAWGGTVVATLPLLATFAGEGHEPRAPSPYTPVSRRFWDERRSDPGLGDPAGPVAVGASAGVEAADLERYAAFRAAGQGGEPASARAAQDAARAQLLAVAATLAARGQRLYLDLPIGAHPEGFDHADEVGLFVDRMAVGAPPDAFFGEGQNWGFPPAHPLDPRSVWHFRDVVRAHMAVAGILRVDHVMGLFRLYWVPDGMSARLGVYVHYPFDALLAVLSVESHRHDCWVVGEDLGTVPDEVRDAMHRHGVLGLWVAEFEREAWWGGRPLLPPADCVACVDTHDTPPFAAWLAETDGDGALDPVGTHAGIVGALGASDAAVVLVSLDDLWGVTEPQNIPGTPAERPNWVHRFPVTLEALADDPRVADVLRQLDRARKESA